MASFSERESRSGLIVEFTGVTGVGKSTLLSAVRDELAARGFAVAESHEVIAASCLGFDCRRSPKLQSLVAHVLALWPFVCYASTRQGQHLSRLAIRLIARDAGSIRIATNLVRNFVKRVGVHWLLQLIQRRLRTYDFILCDEGIIHTAHNVFVHEHSAPNREEISLFAQLVPKPDLVIWVTAPSLQSVECTMRRGHSRVSRTLAGAKAFAEHANAAFAILCSSEPLQEKLVVIDNSLPERGELKATIQCRADTIAELLIRTLATRHLSRF